MSYSIRNDAWVAVFHLECTSLMRIVVYFAAFSFHSAIELEDKEEAFYEARE